VIVVQSRVMFAGDEFRAFEGLDAVPADFGLLQGALEIIVDGRPVLGTRHWDYLVLIWFSMAQALSQFRASGAGSLQFPDQSLDLDLRRVEGGIRLQLCHPEAGTEVVVSEAEFVQAARSPSTSAAWPWSLPTAVRRRWAGTATGGNRPGDGRLAYPGDRYDPRPEVHQESPPPDGERTRSGPEWVVDVDGEVRGRG
jgi:hypothetical protein